MGPQQMPDMDVYNMDIKPHFIYLLFDPQDEFEFYIFFLKKWQIFIFFNWIDNFYYCCLIHRTAALSPRTQAEVQ